MSNLCSKMSNFHVVIVKIHASTRQIPFVVWNMIQSFCALVKIGCAALALALLCPKKGCALALALEFGIFCERERNFWIFCARNHESEKKLRSRSRSSPDERRSNEQRSPKLWKYPTIRKIKIEKLLTAICLWSYLVYVMIPILRTSITKICSILLSRLSKNSLYIQN